MKTRLLAKSLGSRKLGPAVTYACRSVVAVLLVAIVLELSPALMGTAQLVAAGFRAARKAPRSSANASYLASGLWRSDLRTFSAALHYLLEPEPAPVTSEMAQCKSLAELASQDSLLSPGRLGSQFTPPKPGAGSGTNVPARI